MSEWTKTLPGVYTYTLDPRLTVRTVCECSRAGCVYRWGVYWAPDGPGSEYPVPSLYEAYLKDIKRLAVKAELLGTSLNG